MFYPSCIQAMLVELESPLLARANMFEGEAACQNKAKFISLLMLSMNDLTCRGCHLLVENSLV